MLLERHLRHFGTWIQERIVERTGRGIGADGEPLKPRADGTPSRLRESGALLGEWAIDVGATDVSVSPTAPYAAQVDAERPFVGLTDEDIEALDSEVDAALDDAERELGLR